MMSAQIKYAVIQSRDRSLFEEFYLKSLILLVQSQLLISKTANLLCTVY